MWSLEPLLNVTKVAMIRRSTDFFFKWKNIVNSKIYAVFPFERSPHPLGTLARRYDRLGSFGLLLAWNMYLNIWTSCNNRSIFCSSLFSFVFTLFANWHYYLYVHLHSKLLSNDLVVFIQDARARTPIVSTKYYGENIWMKKNTQITIYHTEQRIYRLKISICTMFVNTNRK